MTTEARPGGPEVPLSPEGSVPASIAHPLEFANDSYIGVLDRATELLAPGAAGTTWEAWPADPRSTAHTPSMLRIGSNQGHPILLPGVGQGHILIGNPRLAAPVRPTAPTYGTQTSRELIRQAESAAREDTQQRNKARLAQLERERRKATDITAGLTTRALASVAPGELQVVVYDPHESGAATSAFSPLAEKGLYTNIGLGGLDHLLVRVNKEIRVRYQTSLDGFPNMHARTTLTNEAAPVPWQLIALIGDGEQLSAQNQKLLDNIVRHGSTVGISMLIHGFRAANEPSVHHLRLDGVHAESQSVCRTSKDGPLHHQVNLLFTPDGRPSPQIMWTTANAVAQGPIQVTVPATPEKAVEPEQPEMYMRMLVDDEILNADPDTLFDAPPEAETVRREVPAWATAEGSEEPPAPIVRPTAEEYAGRMPWRRYRGAVTYQAQQIVLTDGLTNRFNANHPWLNVGTLGEITARTPDQVRDETSGHANNMGAFLAEARGLFAHNSGASATDRAQIAAELQLLRGQRSTFQSTRNAGMLMQARDTLANTMPRLVELVAITGQHGSTGIEEFIRPHLEPNLPDEPPAWAFYAVLEASRGVVGDTEALRAIRFDIQETYGNDPNVARMIATPGRVANVHYVNALAELRLLHLYDYTALTPEDEVLRTVLTRHAELRLRNIDPDTLPAQLRPVFNACQEHLEQIGETVTTGDRLSSAADSAGTLVSKLWTWAEKGDDDKKDDEDDNETAAANSPAN